MSSQTREKFATQVNSKILSTVRDLAKSEGRQAGTFEFERLVAWMGGDTA